MHLYKSNLPEVFYKTGVYTSFAKFIENNFAGPFFVPLFSRTPTSNYFYL